MVAHRIAHQLPQSGLRLRVVYADGELAYGVKDRVGQDGWIKIEDNGGGVLYQ